MTPLELRKLPTTRDRKAARRKRKLGNFLDALADAVTIALLGIGLVALIIATA